MIPISLVLIESKTIEVTDGRIKISQKNGCRLEIVRDGDADIDANRLREATRKIVELVDICPESITGQAFTSAIGDVAIHGIKIGAGVVSGASKHFSCSIIKNGAFSSSTHGFVYLPTSSCTASQTHHKISKKKMSFAYCTV